MSSSSSSADHESMGKGTTSPGIHGAPIQHTTEEHAAESPSANIGITERASDTSLATLQLDPRSCGKLTAQFSCMIAAIISVGHDNSSADQSGLDGFYKLAETLQGPLLEFEDAVWVLISEGRFPHLASDASGYSPDSSILVDDVDKSSYMGAGSSRASLASVNLEEDDLVVALRSIVQASSDFAILLEDRGFPEQAVEVRLAGEPYRDMLDGFEELPGLEGLRQPFNGIDTENDAVV